VKAVQLGSSRTSRSLMSMITAVDWSIATLITESRTCWYVRAFNTPDNRTTAASARI
jgi:hypothetical protein